MRIVADHSPSSSAVHKVLDVLLLFDGQDMRLSVDEISQQLAIAKSIVYRYTRILVEKAGAARYRTSTHLSNDLSALVQKSNRLPVRPGCRRTGPR